ncbi:proteoglycan 4 [Hyalella azteca]|uniref:Proteoglycan 4 n=1 Tax=Hyalella azteca TaxID=294128 RepID=A0A8B7NPW5_HYAAZ|nr:proteoglycan 4 [Hyalella azteca]
MTRLLCAGSALLLLLTFLLHPAVDCQLTSPEVKKITILDLFQEEPSLKAELEARLQEKKHTPTDPEGKSTAEEAPTDAEAAGEATPSTPTSTTTTSTSTTTSTPTTTTTTTASEDKRRPSRQPTREPQPAKPQQSDDATVVVEPDEAVENKPTAGTARRVSPHRLALRRSQPGVAAGSPSSTTTKEEAPSAAEPEPEKKEVKEEQNQEAQKGTEETEAGTTAAPGNKKLRARFSLPPRNGNAGGQTTAAPSTGETEAAAGPAKGLNRLRNARLGPSRTKTTAANQEASAADETPAQVRAAETEESQKPAGRLSLAERRSRFNNARTPKSETEEGTTNAETEEETPAAAQDATAAEETSDPQASRRNARRFPTIARRNS